MRVRRKSRRSLSKVKAKAKTRRRTRQRGGLAGSDIPSKNAVVLVNPDPSDPGARVFMSYGEAQKEHLY
jgi:hypothetical protein